MKNLRKNIYLNIILLLLVVFLIFILVYNFKITKLEKIKIDEFDKKVSNYLDEYIDNEDDGKYIIFAIESLSSEKDKNTFSTDEIIKKINNTFDIKYTKKDIFTTGITESMLEKGIVYEDDKDQFIYNNKRTRQDIANDTIVKYNLKSVKKKSRNRFVLKYEIYEVKDPYKILNYYNNLTNKNNDSKKSKIILSYLKGDSTKDTVKDIIDEKNIKEFGKVIGKKKVILIVKDKKLIISNIK